MDRCTQCGFVFQAVPVTDVAGRVRSLPASYAEALRDADRADIARVRPAPATWSALEYTCHVRDVLRAQRERLALALSETCPVFAPMRRDERAVEERYNEQDVAVVLGELADAAEAFATALDGLESDHWTRTGVYPWPAPAERPMAWLARQTLHEGLHHLEDITAGVEVVLARQERA